VAASCGLPAVINPSAKKKCEEKMKIEWEGIVLLRGHNLHLA